jgi:pimeloyl-ACP methyl ester carboxylesterase
MRSRGHRLVAPTYTGLGERAHLAHPGIDLDAHIDDMLAVLHYEDLTDVVLVGHSYGGMVATGVADRAPAKIARLVYLDAFVPRNGEALFDLVSAEARAGMRKAADDAGEGWRIPPNPLPPDTDQTDVSWIMPRRVMQPRKTFEQPIRLTGAGERLPRTYIYCTRPSPGDVFRQFAERARSDPRWRSHEIDASHSPHVTAPAVLADLLAGLAT